VSNPYAHRIDEAALSLAVQLVPWDTEACECVVAHVSEILVHNANEALDAFALFERWRDAAAVKLVSCRIPANRMRESMFLEDRGFRFIEMVLRYRTPALAQVDVPGVTIAQATADDLEAIGAIASTAFSADRFHADPRHWASQRYLRWARSAHAHESQRLYKAVHDSRVIGFLVVNHTGTPWHLFGLAPETQGAGLGVQTVRAFLSECARLGATHVEGIISARNSRMLTLGAKLAWRFFEPEVTLHWVRE
jgi:RimJ/RimL family protein N-acetyltransferase